MGATSLCSGSGGNIFRLLDSVSILPNIILFDGHNSACGSQHHTRTRSDHLLLRTQLHRQTSQQGIRGNLLGPVLTTQKHSDRRQIAS